MGKFVVFVLKFWHLRAIFYCQNCRNGFNAIKERFRDKAIGLKRAEAAHAKH